MNKKLHEIILFIKFSLVGVLGMGTSTLVFFLMTYRIPNQASFTQYIIPYLSSVEAGILVTFFPNDIWVFREEKSKLTLLQRFFAYHGALFSGFLVQTGVFIFLLLISAGDRFAYFAGMGAAALWNYVVSRKAVFA